MYFKDIVIGDSYRVKGDNSRYAKAVQKLKPGVGVNNTKKNIIKCYWSNGRDANFAMVKYFSPSVLVKLN